MKRKTDDRESPLFAPDDKRGKKDEKMKSGRGGKTSRDGKGGAGKKNN